MMTSIFASFDIFNSARSHQFSEERLFNQIIIFIQHFQQYQHLYCESDLLDWLKAVLYDFVSNWFDDQSKFISLHDFDIALTKTFSFSEFVTIQSTNFCSSSSHKQQKLKITFEISKIKRIEFKKISKAKQIVKSTSTFQNIEIFDSTLTSDELEFDLYKEAASFLQHLQQCQHLYRKSKLLNLLSKCLCDFAFEWFKIQFEFISLKRFNRVLAKAFSFAETFSRRASSKRSNLQLNTFDVISESIENSSDFEITCVRVICKLCKQNFNFNKKLYQHIRNHETSKFVKNSHLSINAINLVCEIEKKSLITHESSASFAKSQNSIFESATTFRTIILLKRSYLSFFTFEVKTKSTEKSTTCRHCDEIFNFKKSLREHKREQHRKEFIESFFLSFNTFNSMCENEKKSTFDDSLASSELQASIATSKQKFESAMIFETVVSLKNSHFSFLTLKTKSKSTEKSATCQHCKQTFKFKELFRKHKREQHAKKFVINSFFRSHAFKSVCKTEKKSAIKDVTTLFVSHELRTSDQKVDVQKHSIVNSFLLIDTVKSTCKFAEKSIIVSIAKFSKSISEKRVESRIRIVYLFARLKASRLNFSLNTFVIILETMKNASIQRVACVRAMCRSCKQNFNFNKKLFEHINEHEILKRINTIKATCKFVKISTFSKSIISLKSSFFTSFTLKSLCEFEKKSTSIHSSFSHESLIFTTSRNLTSDTETSLQLVSSKRSNLQLRIFNSASKSMKNASIQSIVCVRTICKRCNQIFNFKNKFHEHIRQHHVRKSVKSSNFRVSTFESAYKIAEKSAITCSLISQFAQSTFFATSRSQIFSTKMSSRFVSFRDSHLTIATFEITSKSMKKISINCLFTFSLSSFRTSIRKHREFHIQKSYFIMNDLSRMFDKKSKSLNLQQHSNRLFSSRKFDIRQFSQSNFSTSKKSYLIIENLFEMFDEKFKRKSLFQNQKNVFFREFFSKQSRITVYFKFTINQKISISQISKSSKSKSLNQHMFAKFIRTVFNKDLFEKSINLSYKMFHNFRVNSKSSVEFFFSSFFVFFQSFFLFSQSFRSFQLQEWVALTSTNKSFRSLIVSILNLSFRNEVEKRRKINCSNI